MNQNPSFNRNRKNGRRLTTTMLAARDGNFTDEQAYFILAMEQWKAENKELYPKWSDVVEVMRLIGYRKVQAAASRLTEDKTGLSNPIPNMV